MIRVAINGISTETANPNMLLIDYLRDEMRLTSVKEGCREGACGTCMVLVDGKPERACVLTVADIDGKSVVTVEGLSKREKEVYAHCFAEAGAVQCGFCTPGMVISAKALLDSNPNPTRMVVKKAIRANICRCTGYVKIEDAILMAAECLRRGGSVCSPAVPENPKLGDNLPRIDAEAKTLGTGLYADDMVVDGMVYAKALRSKYPRARVISIDASKAEKHPDCIRIITAEDVPGDIKCGHLVKDWDALIAVGGTTRYLGDAIAIAVTRFKENLDDVLSLINVEYEQLESVTTPQQALAEGAPRIHDNGNILFEQTLKRGNSDAAIANAAHVVTNRYSLPFTEHAFMEPECAIAVPDGDDNITLYTGGQSVYDEQREVSELLGIDPGKVRVKSMLVGGGFGGKEDMSVQHHASLSAWLVKKPVKVRLSRAESILVHPKRHAMEIDITTACDASGIITAVKAEIIADTGAYASLGGPVLQRACTHLGGPYNYQNVCIRGMAVYTNNPPAGAFRGFGVTQACFAMESNLNMLAKKAGISQWEIRYRNAIKAGQELPNGQLADETTALAECLLAVKDLYEASPRAGIACGFKNSGLGVGVPDIGRCILSVENGKIHVRSSAACIGQGVATVLKQMVCETLDVPADMVIVEPPDTERTPNSGTTTASRQTLFSGEAAILAAKELLKVTRGQVLCHSFLQSDKVPVPLSPILQTLEGREFYGEYNPETDPIGSPKKNPKSHVAYSYAAQVAELDAQGNLIKVTAAFDIGTVVNPKSAEGQIEGGILMGVGYALTEDFPLKDGAPQAKYGTLGLIRATQAPEIETILVCNVPKGTYENRPLDTPAYGAKGVGELATIPTAPAIAAALYRHTGNHFAKLPIK